MTLNQFYGIKIGQSQTFTPEGVRIPVTEILAAPLAVIQVKNIDTDGYAALKVGFGERKEKNIKKPVLGELSKAQNPKSKIQNPKQIQNSKEENSKQNIRENPPSIRGNPSSQQTMYPRYIREIRVKSSDAIKNIKIGDKLSFDGVFKVGDIVNVSGTSIGKGFQGVVKRHHFQGGPRTHGQSDRERAPGSIGQTTTPGRVYKGKRMAGKMGGETATIKNLKVVGFDATRNVVLIKGLVPGKRKRVVKLYR